jgi:hypothetical protein
MVANVINNVCMNFAVLYAPKDYWKAGEDEKNRIYGVCKITDNFDFIQDTIFGLSVKEACDIWCWMYCCAREFLEDKDEADRVFLNNMLRLINAKTKRYFKFLGLKFKNPMLNLRRRGAYKNYLVVKRFGAPVFWLGKQELGTVHFSKLGVK